MHATQLHPQETSSRRSTRILGPDQGEGVWFLDNLLTIKARGDSGPESDIDILVVASTEHWRFRHAISDLASDVSLEYGVLIAPRVIAQERWERMRQASYSFYRNVAREGVSLSSGR